MAHDFKKAEKELTGTHFGFEGQIRRVFTHFFGYDTREAVKTALEFAEKMHAREKLIEDIILAAKRVIPYVDTCNSSHREAQAHLSALLKDWEAR